MTATQLWWITLGAGLLVSIAVGVLLMIILRTARRIAATLSEIWTVGQMVANNTLHIDQLRRTAFTTEEVLASLELSSQYARRLRARE